MAIVMTVALLIPNLAGVRLNNMAEETKQKEEQQAPPWTIDFNPIATKALETIKTATEPIKAAIASVLPWEQNYAAKRPVEAPSPIQAQKPSFSFEQVFNKLVSAESRGRHASASGELTTSPVGAQGITQVMPKTGRDPGFGVTPIQDTSEKEYLRFGRDYLRAMLKEFGGDYEKAVAAYNAGHVSVKRAITKAAKEGGDWKNYLPKKSETLPYLKRILG